MLATLRTAVLFGVDAHLVQVEVDVSFGIPSFSMVGLPDASVRESRDRVRSAIRNCGYEFPPHRITVNLSPADLRKAGAAFDLPIALGVLAAAGSVAPRQSDHTLILGELSLDGTIQPTRGVLAVAVAATRGGLRTLIVPRPNAAEAALVTGVHVVPVDSLAGAVGVYTRPDTAEPYKPAPLAATTPPRASDFAEICGQGLARRAMELAAAGGHHVLLVGPPGSGKTMLARRLPGILPPLSFDEALECTVVHSVAGLLASDTALLTERPFRAPHHTISNVALVGGGGHPRPGEISLAHHGVLFLDELPEFERHVLEVLRQPLEDGSVTIARAARTVRFPARFQLVAAMNPCPCGFLGHPTRSCRCPPTQTARYRDRVSGPLRDRLDLTVDVPAVPVAQLHGEGAEPTAAIRRRVVAARQRQHDRLQPFGLHSNAELDGARARQLACLDPAGRRLLATASERLSLSARAHDRVLKVARTAADLAGDDRVSLEHVAEALQFRAIL